MVSDKVSGTFKQLTVPGVGSSPTIISGDWQEPRFNLGIEVTERGGRQPIAVATKVPSLQKAPCVTEVTV